MLQFPLIFRPSSYFLPNRDRRLDDTSSAAGPRREACDPSANAGLLVLGFLPHGFVTGVASPSASRVDASGALRPLSPRRTSVAALSPVRCGEFTSPGTTLCQ